MKRLAAAWFLILVFHHSSAGAQSAKQGTSPDYCSRIRENLIILNATDPMRCGIGTARILGLTDKLVLEGVFGLEIGLGIRDKEVTAEPVGSANKAASFVLRFNRHNAFLGFRLKW